MRYKTKVLLLLIALAGITNSFLVAVVYLQTEDIVYSEIQSKVLSMAATASSFVDGDLHKEIKTRADEETANYEKLARDLRKVRDANRRDDVYAQYVYTMTLSPDSPSVILFGVDGEENPSDKSHVGDVYKGNYDEALDLSRHQVDQNFTVDQWGTWLSANAPIQDSQGNFVASLGVDIKADDVVKKLESVLTSSALGLAVSISLAILLSLFLAKRVTLPLVNLKEALDEIGKGNLDARVHFHSKDEFDDVAQAVNSMAQGLKERKKLKSLFSRYVSSQVASDLMNSEEKMAITGQRRKITVLFSDIRGFTEMSETMRPEEVVKILNEYYEKMIEVIFRNKGTLDKFLGDGMMVLFGAPREDLEQEEHALQAAIEMQKEVLKLQERWKEEGKPILRIGIGINSGNAIVGNVGSEERTEYTAIGDTVNLASRIESMTKELQEDILISEYTYNAVRGLFPIELRGGHTVKGRKDPINLYGVKHAPSPHKRENPLQNL